MAENLFKRAKAYRKKHPSVSQSEAVSLLAQQDRNKKPTGKKHTAARKVVKHKKTARKKTPARKVKVKTKKGTTRVTIGKAKRKAAATSVKKWLGISGVSMDKIRQEHSHQGAIQSAIHRHQAQLKTKGQTKQEKTHIRREIKAYRQQLAASKKHVTVLKRSL